MSTTNDAPDRASPFGIEQTAPEQTGAASAHCAPASGSPPVSQRQELCFVDATPDAEYPLRILRAHRELCNCTYAGDWPADLMNQWNTERARVLDRAIDVLESANRPRIAHSCDIPGCVACGNPPEDWTRQQDEDWGVSEENTAVSQSATSADPRKSSRQSGG